MALASRVGRTASLAPAPCPQLLPPLRRAVAPVQPGGAATRPAASATRPRPRLAALEAANPALEVIPPEPEERESTPFAQTPGAPGILRVLNEAKAPKWLFRTVSCLVLGGQVVLRIFKGNIHWRNTMDQLKLVGPQSLGVSLLTASFVGMVFTIQGRGRGGAMLWRRPQRRRPQHGKGRNRAHEEGDGEGDEEGSFQHFEAIALVVLIPPTAV
ncbi:Protein TRIGALACTOSYLDIACYLGLYCEROL 1, chloroplastic [Tetrabaena socialis]|uniref:Protein TRIGALACTOSYLDIACYLGLYCEROL 1, chloroplastic n=1 Tax=Tetrabaena socialis TaxID=47790 RepID=A0A2J8A093_9CHLO|nr:Protein TRIGALACTOSYLDIACYLGLYCEROL 1, chloroplastic [Tetrabaena socialis]|eukprot:PNH05926.1 Protein TRIGALACTOSYLDIACYLGLYCEROL 1, chloroplastic [Tetrabaena socialis]